MYSRHSRGFFARSVFNRTLRKAGLQLPHFVFIFCTKTRCTLTPTVGSHLAIKVGTAALICSRYHWATTSSFLSWFAPWLTRKISLLCFSSIRGAEGSSMSFSK